MGLQSQSAGRRNHQMASRNQKVAHRKSRNQQVVGTKPRVVRRKSQVVMRRVQKMGQLYQPTGGPHVLWLAHREPPRALQSACHRAALPPHEAQSVKRWFRPEDQVAPRQCVEELARQPVSRLPASGQSDVQQSARQQAR